MGHPTYVREGGSGKTLHVSPDAYKAPSLSAALLKGAVNQWEQLMTPKQKELAKENRQLTLQTDFEKELGELLTHLQQRLEAGCGEAWLADEAYGPNLDKKAIEDKLKQNPPSEADQKAPDYYQKTYAAIWDLLEYSATPEEQWARAFSEMVVFSMYGNPSHLHYWKDDASGLFEKFEKSGWHATAMACQHLSTYAILSRGFPASDVGGGCACSAGTIKLACFDKTDQTAEQLGLAKAGDADAGKTHPKSETSAPLKPPADKQTAAPYFAKTDILAKKEANPGSVVAFNPGGPGYGGQDKGPITHIGTILRRHGTYVQFIDTGVLVGNDEAKGAGSVAGGEGGTTDHGFVNGTVPASNHCVAVGVLKKEPGDLIEAAKKTAAAKPLGFARLAVVDMSDKANPVVRYVSRMRHMQYPVSRYIWSLRGLPVKGLRVLWMLYAAQGEEHTETLMANPKDSPANIWTKAREQWDAKKKAAAPEDAAKDAQFKADKAAGKEPKPVVHWVDKHPMSFYLTNIIRGEDTGKAVVCRRKTDKKDGYVEDFEGPPDSSLPSKPGADMGQGYDLDVGSKLGPFCTASATLDSQYKKKPGAGEKGATDTKGNEDFLAPK